MKCVVALILMSTFLLLEMNFEETYRICLLLEYFAQSPQTALSYTSDHSTVTCSILLKLINQTRRKETWIFNSSLLREQDKHNNTMCGAN